jgi:hypothetical protein
MKSSIFWDIMSYSALKVNDVSEEHVASIFMVNKKTSVKAGDKQSLRFHTGSLLGILLDSEDGGDMFLRNVC